MKPFKIGDKVWYASRKTINKSIVCPECFGKKALTVILGDDSTVSIDCAGCASGYDPPKGYVTFWEQSVNVSEEIIQKIIIEIDKVEYGFNNCYSTDEKNIFLIKEDAEKRASELAEEHNKEELEKIYRKEKNNHTWSWNVHYHRNCIRNCERDLIYHKAKLAVAKTN